MTRNIAISTAACAALILGFGLGVSPADAQVAAIQSQDLNQPGLVADLIEARRSEGVLSIRMRLKNTGAKKEEVRIYNPYYGFKIEAFYVQAEGKKYFMLRDTEKVPLAAGGESQNFEPSVAPGASFTWWAKYPAPPANVKKFGFYWPLGAPFDDVPITDK